MKTTAEIEKLTLGELEKMAEDTSVNVPDSLGSKVADAVLAADALASPKRRDNAKKYFLLIPAAAAAVVAAVAIGLNVHGSTAAAPADTFSTPEEALACLEQTFNQIGIKTAKSLETAESINSKLEKTYGLILKNE